MFFLPLAHTDSMADVGQKLQFRRPKKCCIPHNHLTGKSGKAFCVVVNNIGMRRHLFNLGADPATNDQWILGRNNASGNVATKR